MADLRTTFVDFAGDWTVAGPVLAEDAGLKTAVVISLFTDRLAEADDVLPDAGQGVALNRRGWWGDAYTDTPGDRIGSRLWLLAREKQRSEVLRRAETYAAEALQWLLDDGVAREVNVVASSSGPGVLALDIEIVRSAQPVARYRFEDFWKGQ